MTFFNECAMMNASESHVQHNDYNKFAGGRPFVQTSGIPESFRHPLEHPEIVLPLEMTSFTIEQSVENAMILLPIRAPRTEKEGRILRFYNSTENQIEFSINFNKKISAAYLTSMNEDLREQLAPKNNQKLILSAKPKEIVTIKII